MSVRYSLARKAARALLARGAVTEPPIPVEHLAELAGAVIRFVRFRGELASGSVQRKVGSPAIIGVNESHSQRRKRFTVAHELGHLLLHVGEDVHFDQKIHYRNDVSARALDEAEVEANQFAAELLMPEAFLRQDLEELDEIGDREIEYLADRYDVSLQAMSIRLSALRYVR